MKCPYQTITVHVPESLGHYAQERVTFGDCFMNECPFYLTKEHKQAVATHIIGFCGKTESEIKK